MANPTSLKSSQLLTRASIVANEIVVEENNLRQAIENNVAGEKVEAMKARISFLKRKQLLFSQAAKLRKYKD